MILRRRKVVASVAPPYDQGNELSCLDDAHDDLVLSGLWWLLMASNLEEAVKDPRTTKADRWQFRASAVLARQIADRVSL
jgi:hypothetical protein